MKIEKNDMVMVYDGGGTVPHCKYTGRFGDLTAYWQKIVSDALKVLYCVNQLNEAVHVKGVDAIVMVRPTKSPTVFYQQLGRVLSSGGNRTPLVFDFCNNFGSIVAAERIPKRMEETFKRLTGESEQLPFTPSDFRIIDRTLTYRQLTDEIRKSLKRQSIEDKITFLEQMAQLNGGKL